MNIAIDGKRFFLNTSGLGRYSRSLVNSLLSLKQSDDFLITLFQPRGPTAFQAPDHARLTIVKADYRIPGDLGNSIWRFWVLPRLLEKGNISLFHGPSHILPKAHCPMVVTMFDLIFLRYPHYFPLWDRQYYRVMFRKSCHRADHIICISEATKADLIHFFSIDESKITIIYPSLELKIPERVAGLL